MLRTFEISEARYEFEGLRWVTVKSAALGGRGDLTLWVPAGVAPVGAVVLLHGVYGSHWAWAMKGGAHRTAARLVEAREIPPVVLVMPSDGLWGDGSGYVGHRERDYERWIVEDVREATRRAVPTLGADAAWFIHGLSMGGFGALRLGAKYGDRFRGAAGHSSITEFEQLRRFVEEPLSAYGVASEDRGVLETILRHRSRLPALRFDCGVEDPLIAANRELHAALEAEGIGHQYEEFPGGHEWPYWEVHLADTLRFFGGLVGGTGGVRPSR